MCDDVQVEVGQYQYSVDKVSCYRAGVNQVCVCVSVYYIYTYVYMYIDIYIYR